MSHPHAFVCSSTKDEDLHFPRPNLTRRSPTTTMMMGTNTKWTHCRPECEVQSKLFPCEQVGVDYELLQVVRVEQPLRSWSFEKEASLSPDVLR